VDAFVCTGRLESTFVAAEDDVAEGDRRGATRHQRGVGQQPRHHRSVNFEDAIHYQRMSTPEACGYQQQAEDGGRRGPHVATEGEQAAH
jgi:hypothetical protein